MDKIVVIGAGIVGATAAYKLAKKGARVVLVDRNDKGMATDAAAGIISPWLAQRRNKAWYHLAQQGAKNYPNLISELNQDGEILTGYSKVGSINLYTDTKRLKAAKERVLKRRKDAPEIGEINILSASEVKRIFPLVEDDFEAIHISGAARIDGYALRRALINGAKKHGATILEGNAKLLLNNNKLTGISIEEEFISAKTIIATTGAWMKELIEPLGVELNIYPQKAQIIELEMLEQNTDNWPVIMPPNNQYILPFSNNRIIIGATHESKAGFNIDITAGGVHEILTKALKIAPKLSNSTIIETKVGFRPFTKGSLPIIGHLPNYSNLILANGLGASGLTTGPYIGTQLAKLALNERLNLNLDDYQISQAIK